MKTSNQYPCKIIDNGTYLIDAIPCKGRNSIVKIRGRFRLVYVNYVGSRFARVSYVPPTSNDGEVKELNIPVDSFYALRSDSPFADDEDELLKRGLGRIAQAFKPEPKIGKMRPCGQRLIKLQTAASHEYALNA